MRAWMGRDTMRRVSERRWDVAPDGTGESARSVTGGSRVVLEARVLAEEGQLHRAVGAVTLLADDDLGDALVGRIFVVDLVAVDEEDHVRVLLQSSRFAKVRHHRA